MKRIALLFSAVFSATILFAQTTDLGDPIGWNGKLPAPQSEGMATFDLSAIQAEDAINDPLKDRPWRFGYKYNTSYNLTNSGTWTTLPNGDKVWRLEVKCRDALTVNFIFENLFIPEGAAIHLYDSDMTNVVGAYTSRNNRDDGLLGTELVHGEQVIIEYFEPLEVAGEGSLTVANVIHGYRSLNIIQDELQRALNSSGDCNYDVRCPLGTGWDDQIRSVAMIVVSGNGICTGALINNTCDDGTPYFLTADHCLGATGTWAFRFNWETAPGTEACASVLPNSVDPGPPYDQTANGATVLANSGASDFALLQIDNMTVADAMAWNCFYAGWDNTDALTVTEAWGIHHPSGDVKKICWYNAATTQVVWGGAQCWGVADWTQGVTEPGSSGSPLFDQNGRIIGQLYGGSAACAGTNDNGAPDYYGRFGVSWGLGVSGYLAPGACGGSVPQNDGWDPNTPTLPDDAGITAIIEPQGVYCTDTFDPEVTLRNYGTNTLTSVTIQYQVDGGPIQTQGWTGSLAPGNNTNVTLATQTVAGGPHTFDANTTLPNGNPDSDPTNDASNSTFTATPTGEIVDLTLTTDCWGSEVTWEVVQGATQYYAGGPYSDVAGGEVLTEQWCLAPGCYDFIIYDSYGDGMYGSQWGSCTVDGDYSIDQGATNLASLIAVNADYGTQETNNFCVVSGCPTITVTATSTDETCAGLNDGTITVSATGGTTPYLYDIGGPQQTSPNFTGVAPGTYTVTVTDAAGCTGTTSVTVNGPPVLTGTITALTDASCNGSCDGSVTVTAAGGVAPYSYDIGGGPQGSGTFSPLCAGTYTILITDANGCTTTVPVTITEPTALSGTIASQTNVTCNGACDGTVDVTAAGGTAPYTYDIGGGPQGSGTFTGLCAGSYTVTITDANGCTTTVNVTITEPTALSCSISGGTHASCNSVCDGTATVAASGGVAPYSYSWSSGGTGATETGLCAGTYTVTVTDANGCTCVTNVTINEPSAISITGSITDATCGNSDGAIDVTVTGGTTPYMYAWTGPGGPYSTEDLTGIAAGSYSLTVTDANGCTGTYNGTVSDLGGPTATATMTSATCFGSCDGSITITATGGAPPYNYDIGGAPNTTGNFTGLCAGTYTYTVTDAGGCSTGGTITVTEPTAVTCAVATTDVSCNGICDGTATVTVAGGTAPYTYSWSSGGTGSIETGLCAGTYTVTVTDANGCTCVSNFTITEPTVLVATGAVTSGISCNAACDGEVTITATGGTAPYTGDGVQTGVCAGSWTYTVTDANGCAAIASGTITEPSAISISGSITDATCGNSDGAIDVTVTGGTSPYTYDWNSGAFTTEDLTGIPAGLYDLTVTDANGCTGTYSGTVNDIGGPTLSVVVTDESAPGNNGAIDLTVTGGVSPYTFDWDNDGTGDNDDTEDLTGLSGGTYTVIVTDANGCTTTLIVTVNSTVSVEDLTNEVAFTLYPNPSSGLFNVSFEGLNSEKLRITVFDAGGKLIVDSEFENIAGDFIHEIDITSSERGAYLIRVIADDRVSTKTITKQ